MTTPNSDREDGIRGLVLFANAADLEELLYLMPKAEDDPDDVKINDYFEILRDFYYIQANWRLVDEESLKEWAGDIAERSKAYGLSLEKVLSPLL